MQTKLSFFFAFILLVATSTFAQTTPGSISADAKYLEVDELGDFSDGLAVVRNFNSSAIINSVGNIVLPFNKYTIPVSNKFREGFLPVGDLEGKNFGYMNKELKLITPLIFRWGNPFFKDKFALNQRNNKDPKDWYQTISVSGKLTPISRFVNNKLAGYDSGLSTMGMNWQDGMVSYYIDVNGANRYGYVSRNGVVVVQPKYLWAFGFGDGLAAVAAIAADGERKYGFIDKTGKMIIPLTYSKSPDGFSNGLCLVEPLKNPEFDYAYINKKGEIAFKIKLSDFDLEPADRYLSPIQVYNGYDNGTLDHSIIYGNIKHPFQGNYTFWLGKNYRPKLIAKDGSVKDIITMLTKAGVMAERASSYDLNFHHLIVNEHIIFTFKKKFGMITTDGKLIVPPVFDRLSHFDTVSGLALARIYPGNNTVIDGYINTNGVFKIVKKDKTGL